jgi:hypothetical protein
MWIAYTKFLTIRFNQSKISCKQKMNKRFYIENILKSKNILPLSLNLIKHWNSIWGGSTYSVSSRISSFSIWICMWQKKKVLIDAYIGTKTKTKKKRQIWFPEASSLQISRIVWQAAVALRQLSTYFYLVVPLVLSGLWFTLGLVSQRWMLIAWW